MGIILYVDGAAPQRSASNVEKSWKMKETLKTELETLVRFINHQVPACRFVGLTSDHELFVEFEHDNSGYMKEAKHQILEAFPELSGVVAVIKPSIAQLTQMVENLNKIIEENESPAPVENKSDLLDIGEF
jgi:hypothetical protein